MADKAADHAVQWAFDFLSLSIHDNFDHVSRRVHEHCIINRDDVDVKRMYMAQYAKDIVLAVARYLRFNADAEYNNKYMHIDRIVDQTAFQKLLLFLLRRLSELKYRRYGDGCHEMMEIAGRPTCCWRRVCSIREFVLREVRKEMEPEQWKNMTNPRDNLDAVSKHLMEIEHVEFPSILVDDTLISWRNGIWSMEDNIFYPYDRQEEWVELARRVEAERRAREWGDAYELRPPAMHACTCSFIDRDFRVCDEGNKMFIDQVCNLLSEMGVDASLHGWIMVLFGRLLFPINKKDRWSVMPYFKTSDTADNAALVAISSIFQKVLGRDGVAQLASGTNVQHALETLMHSRMCALLFRDYNMPIEQGDWQSVVCGEPVCINPSRGRTSYSHQWTSHLIAVGPVFGYKNDAGTVDRRVLMFDVSNGTPEMFQQLRERLDDHIDLWLQTIVAAYLTATHEHGEHDIWSPNVLPPIMQHMRESLREMVSPLLKCILSATFTRDRSVHMPLNAFKDLYQEFRRRRGLPPQRWIREHWQATFQDMELTIERGQKEYHGVKSTTDWLCGIDTVERVQSQAPTVSIETLKHLSNEELRLEGDLGRIRERLTIARQLYEADEKVQEWKTVRGGLRQRYASLTDE